MYRLLLIIGIAFALVSCKAQELTTPLAGRWKYTAIQPKDSAWTPVTGTYYEQIAVEFRTDGKISYYLNNTLTTDPCRIPCIPTAYTYSTGKIAFTDWASCPYVDCAPATAWHILKLDKDVLEVAPEGISTPHLRLERTR